MKSIIICMRGKADSLPPVLNVAQALGDRLSPDDPESRRSTADDMANSVVSVGASGNHDSDLREYSMGNLPICDAGLSLDALDLPSAREYSSTPYDTATPPIARCIVPVLRMDHEIMSKVSVIIPTYNRTTVIERAVQSVLTQTFEDMEIIIVDDGSTDNTKEIVQSMHDKRIRYIRCETNRGPSVARNEGLKVARGKYVAFLDSDDEWLPEKTENQVALMESLSEDWGFSYTGARFIKDGCRESLTRPAPAREGNAFSDLVFGRIYIPTPGLMIRTKCLEHVGFFDDRLRVNEDNEFLLRLSRKYKLAIMPEPTVIVHCITSKQRSDLIEPARLLILQKHYATIRNELGWYAARYFQAHIFWVIADSKFRDMRFFSGLSYWLRATTSTPFMSPKRYLGIALACSGLLPLAKKLLWGSKPTSLRPPRQDERPLPTTEDNLKAETSSEKRAA